MLLGIAHSYAPQYEEDSESALHYTSSWNSILNDIRPTFPATAVILNVRTSPGRKRVSVRGAPPSQASSTERDRSVCSSSTPFFITVTVAPMPPSLFAKKRIALLR